MLATDSVTIGSLAVGALFRVLCETSFVFVGAALVFAAIAPKLREPRNRGEGIGS